MEIRGNVTYKDNMKLVYINLALVAACVFLLYGYYTEKNYKPIVAVDTGHAVYAGRLMRVKDPEAVMGQLHAHIRLSYLTLYNLTEYNYEDNTKQALHLWSYTGGEVVTDFEREGLYDFLSTTPSRNEVLIRDITYLGEKEIQNLKYPQVYVDPETDEISFRDHVLNGVKTYMFEVVTYRRLIRGREAVIEEIHTEGVEVYTGFDVDPELNPFGYKTETITRTIENFIDK